MASGFTGVLRFTGNGAAGFGRDNGRRDHDRYPAVHVQLMRKPLAPGASSTPVAPSSSTPVAPGVATSLSKAPGDKAPLAVLDIFDATGSPKRDVLKLPFTIGRGSAQDYIVPDANQGVSREHLVIEEINRSGAVTLNRAVSRNGTFAGNQALPERFVWRFGQEIVLGEPQGGEPVEGRRAQGLGARSLGARDLGARGLGGGGDRGGGQENEDPEHGGCA